ncbi:MAG TPA: hemolysin III family protein [Metalysinibacillus sp.]
MFNPYQDGELREEIWSALTHGFGLLISIPALIILILQSTTALQITTVSIFGASLILLFLASTLLHSMPFKYKYIFAKLDHSAIYILIAGTYTPFLLLAVGGKLGLVLLITIWALAVVGVFVKFFFFTTFEKLSTFAYIAMGWLIIFAAKPVYLHLGFEGFVILVSGGLWFTVGTIFYAWRSLPYNHAIWHLFVIMGCVTMYYCVLVYLL